MRRVVISGIGVVAPGGIGREAFWNTLESGTSACDTAPLDNIERFRSQIAGSVSDWVPLSLGLSPAEVEQWDRHIQFALVASREAWADSGLDHAPLEAERIAVAAGTAIGSTIRLEQEYLVVSKGATQLNVDPDLASSYLYHAVTPSSLSAVIADAFHACGPVATISTGCTAGIDAIAQAFEWIRDGDADIAVGGASEAGICPINIASFDAIKATSRRNTTPKTASRPFDGTRDGFVLGEGCAFVVLEDLEHARKRHAHIYAEIRGYGSALNAYHMTGLQRDGLDMAQAIGMALEAANMPAGQIDHINAHGSSTRQNDLHETNAFKAVWGDQVYQIPINSIKCIVGHSLGAIGAIEIVACSLALHHGVIPPTINYQAVDPECDLDYVPNKARYQPIQTLISTASGFGGFQSAMVLSTLEAGDHV